MPAAPLLAQQRPASTAQSGESSSRNRPRTARGAQDPSSGGGVAQDVYGSAGWADVAQAEAAPPRAAAPGAGQQGARGPVIQRIEFQGNRRVPADTLRSRISTRVGDALSEEALFRDFQALWNMQLFEDIRLEVEDSPDRAGAVVVVFYVRERPVIRRIRYCKMKEQQLNPGEECSKFDMISESDILERFKDRKVGLSVESRFDPTRIKRAEVVLKELLGERGRQYAVVRPVYSTIPGTNAVELTFVIDPGPKVKVGDIVIEGHTAFSRRKIIRAMRHSRPYAVPMWLFDWNVMSKTYHSGKLSEDLEIGIRGLYQDHGYFTVLVKEPIVETEDVKRGGLPGPWPLVGRKSGKRAKITIPIQEGDQYRLGKLYVRSVDPEKGLFFKQEFLQDIFPIKPGEIFSVEKIRKALEDYNKLYGTYGFIDFVATPVTDVDPEKKEVNLTLEFSEQKSYYVRRIEFSGNTTTRDKVIRREILLDEGDLFNNRAWEVSLLRINQLDFFDNIKPEHAEIKRNAKEGSVDILLKVKEKGKQSIGLTGGISGVAGSFIGISYQTNNLLGRGETLTFSADFGDRQRNFIFGYTNPYFLDRPISAGFTLFSSRFSYNQAREAALVLGRPVSIDPTLAQNYDTKRKGFTIFASYPVRKWSFARVGISYSLTSNNISAFSQASQLLFQSIQFRQLVAGPTALSGIRSSRIAPSISYSTVDNPINPTSGKSFFYSFAMEGGVLGGNINTLAHTFEAKYFRPINRRRNVLGFRVISAFATGYGGLVLPPYNRFYLGGEDTVRGFDYLSITPWAYVPSQSSATIFYQDPRVLDSTGNPTTRQVSVPILDYTATTPGGDLQVVTNAEYRIPLVGPVSMALFFDTGINGILRNSQLRLDPNGLARLQSQFPSATISEKLAIASGSNFRVRTSTGIEFIVQLPVVNAPFRIYYAYNLTRYKDEIVEPRGDFFVSDQLRNSLPPGVYESQFLPQLNATLDRGAGRGRPFEPLKTFRFTVSRTF
jgi:outer membrane protein insertion porin family